MVCCFLDRKSIRKRAEDQYGKRHGWTIYNCYASIRFLQFVTGIVVVALYAQDIDFSVDIAQIYILVFGAVSALLGLVLVFPVVAKPSTVWLLDIFVCLNYVVEFALWGRIFLKEPEPGLVNTADETVRLLHACYVDAAGIVLWAATGFYTSIRFYRERKNAKRTTQGLGGDDAFDSGSFGIGDDEDEF